ncbi:hypothetical protein D9M71_466810 [compost metagenome]
MTGLNDHKISAVERVAIIEESNKFITQHLASRRIAGFSSAQLPVDKDELNAAIMGAGIAGFHESMSKRSKRIVKNTYMYADLFALLKYPSSRDKQKRYAEFMRIMKIAGWFAFNEPYNRYKATSQKLSMDNVALGIIHTAIGTAVSNGAAAAKVLSSVADATMEALKNEPEALKLFEDNSKKADGGNFCMSSSMQGKDDDITMAIAAVQYFAHAQPTKVLFVDWSTSSIEIYNGAATMHMDEEDYLVVEPKIEKILSEHRQRALTYEFGKA